MIKGSELKNHRVCLYINIINTLKDIANFKERKKQSAMWYFDTLLQNITLKSIQTKFRICKELF